MLPCVGLANMPDNSVILWFSAYNVSKERLRYNIYKQVTLQTVNDKAVPTYQDVQGVGRSSRRSQADHGRRLPLRSLALCRAPKCNV